MSVGKPQDRKVNILISRGIHAGMMKFGCI